MNDSIVITKHTTVLIDETGYDCWLNFWLNARTGTNKNEFNYKHANAADNRMITLPFNIKILEILAFEEFKIIMQHLLCGDLADFVKSLRKIDHLLIDGFEPFQIVIRKKDNSVHLREYQFTETAIQKIKQLVESNPPHSLYVEKEFEEF